MALAELSSIWREALAVREAFCRLGFASEQIYINRLADHRLAVGLPDVGPGFWWLALVDDYSLRQLSHNEFVRAWTHAVELWNASVADAKATDDAELFDNSRVRKLLHLFVISILNTGIALPSQADA